jgi:hypothetical protein
LKIQSNGIHRLVRGQENPVRIIGRRSLIWVVFQKVFPGHGFSFEDCLNLSTKTVSFLKKLGKREPSNNFDPGYL